MYEIIYDKCQTKKDYYFHGIVFLEGLTLSEQISIFQNNDIIISPHGANLIHSIWFENKTIIEIVFEERKNIMYKRICNLIGNEIIQIHRNNILSFLRDTFLN
jgi:capsular polysaccharide biosynthesis protein